MRFLRLEVSLGRSSRKASGLRERETFQNKVQTHKHEIWGMSWTDLCWHFPAPTCLCSLYPHCQPKLQHAWLGRILPCLAPVCGFSLMIMLPRISFISFLLDKFQFTWQASDSPKSDCFLNASFFMILLFLLPVCGIHLICLYIHLPCWLENLWKPENLCLHVSSF